MKLVDAVCRECLVILHVGFETEDRLGVIQYKYTFIFEKCISLLAEVSHKISRFIVAKKTENMKLCVRSVYKQASCWNPDNL